LDPPAVLPFPAVLDTPTVPESWPFPTRLAIRALFLFATIERFALLDLRFLVAIPG
jgi:hypothetical protein